MAIDINYSETRGPNVDDFFSPEPTMLCFLPICMYSFMASRTFLQEYLPWATSKCSQSKIIIGDYLERHNLMVFDSITETEAINKASKKGEKINRIIRDVLDSTDHTNRVEVCSCRDDIEKRECRSIADSLRRFAGENVVFSNDLDEQLDLMISGTQRVLHHNLSRFTDTMMSQLREYMIEELALYIFLYNQGFVTEVYPGRDMKILRKIASAQYRNFPFDLSERTHISVTVMLDGGISYACLDNNNGEGDTI